MQRLQFNRIVILIIAIFCAALAAVFLFTLPAAGQSEPSNAPAAVSAAPASVSGASAALSAQAKRPPLALPAGKGAGEATLETGEAGLIINEILFNPASGGSEWVELKNTGASPAAINGYGLTGQDGRWYRFPDDLPPVPPGAFVLVIFDGLGAAPTANDIDFSDNLATLHTPPGLTDIFGDAAGQCALFNRFLPEYHSLFLPLVQKDRQAWNPAVPAAPPADFPPSALVSFLAWGAPPQAELLTAGEITSAGQPQRFSIPPWYKSLARGLGANRLNQPVPNETIGLLPGGQPAWPAVLSTAAVFSTADDWALYQASQATPGSENAGPLIAWFYPPAGAQIAGGTFTISWARPEGAAGYRFQLDDESSFNTPLVDVSLADAAYTPAANVPDGAYFWRVKTYLPGGLEGPWSPAVPVQSVTLATAYTSGVSGYVQKTISIPWQMQRKDTGMLCLDGDPESGASAWDSPHTTSSAAVPSTAAVPTAHDSASSVRAAIAMLASYYGGRLSQDHIGYAIFGGGSPDGDLGHALGVNLPPDPAISNTLAWALGLAPDEIPARPGKPTFLQIKTWIHEDRPVLSVIPGHIRLINGYTEYTLGGVTWQWLLLVDPWDRPKWVRYNDENMIYTWVGPAAPGGAPGVRSDPDEDHDGMADTLDDSDGDGIVDFDERYRFHTDPAAADSDHDQVPDQLDLSETLFNSAGAFEWRDPDIDGDGLRKELDPDNDAIQNDGMIDGCEDDNRDGRFAPGLGETFNFQPSDDLAIHAVLTWPALGADLDLHLLRPGGTLWTKDDCFFLNKTPDWGQPGTACDDPRMGDDCRSGCTIEVVRLPRPEPGVYIVLVHYYALSAQAERPSAAGGAAPPSPAHLRYREPPQTGEMELGSETAAATLTLWVNGIPYTFGPRPLTSQQMWTVASIDWPSGQVTTIDKVAFITNATSAAAAATTAAPLPGGSAAIK